jgi:hypothetical protein
MTLPTWRELYESYLFLVETVAIPNIDDDDFATLIEGTQFRGDFSIPGFHCWKVVYKKDKTIIDVYGNKEAEEIVESHAYYIWLGTKGSIYITTQPIFSKKISYEYWEHDLPRRMRNWAARKFWQLKND